MKKYIAPLLLIAASLAAPARQLSPAEALARLNSSGEHTAARLAPRADKTPVFTVANDRFTSLYVFDTSDSGFVILSADDCAVPMLAYSDRSTFDPDNIPPQLQEWLQSYAREIEWAANKKANATAGRHAAASGTAERPARDSIAPLTTSLWNQEAPYNDDCPTYEGHRTVTGCVATAMAQVMYYHRWPETGTGSKSYYWSVGDTTLSLNFADITFDWDNMTDTYNKESTAAQKAAVAELMYACGVSVHMHYMPGGSGAAPVVMGNSLKEYFGYAKNMAYPQRYFYGLIDWENLVYEQLAQGLPVLYNGQGREGGHEFICDGYSSDGYFHFNWGWSGMSDGYYLLSALDPIEQGIGGDLTGFDYEQGIWVNVRPASESDSVITPYIYGYGNFETSATAAVDLGSNVDFIASKDFMNFTDETLSGRFGIQITGADGSSQYVAEAADITIDYYSGRRQFTVKLPADLADGTYTVTPAFYYTANAKWYPVLCSLSGVQAQTMTVSNSKATFADAEPATVEVSDVQINTPFYFDTDFSITMTAENPGTQEYFGEILVALVDDAGKRVDTALMSEALSLAAGESSTVDIVSQFPATVNKTDTVAPGSYYLQIYEYMTDNVLYTSTGKVSIASAPATTIKVDTLAVVSQKQAADGKIDITFDGTVQCVSGYFAGQLQVRIYRKGEDYTTAKVKTDFIFVDPGSSSAFTATAKLDDASQGEEFYARIFSDDEPVGTEEYPFVIDTTDGINAAFADSDTLSITISDETLIASSSAPISEILVYDITGQLVGEANSQDRMDISVFPPAYYIAVAKDATGRTATLHFIR